MSMPAIPPQPAWKTYLLVCVAMTPTFFVWIFSLTVLFPKFELLWAKFGPEAEGRPVTAALTFMISSSRFTFNNFVFILCGVGLVLAPVEVKWKAWGHWRATVLTVITILLNAAVMVSLALMTALSLMLVTKALVMASEAS